MLFAGLPMRRKGATAQHCSASVYSLGRIEAGRQASEVYVVNLSDDRTSPGDAALVAARVCRIGGAEPAVQSDLLAVEEPLEIRVGTDEGGRHVHRAVC